MEADGTIAAFENGIKLAGHQPILDEKQQKAMDAIEAEYREAGASPPFASEIEKRLGHESQALITLLLESGRLVNVTTDIHFHSAALQDAENKLRAYLESHGQMTVAQFRDLVGSSRKYVVPLLEYFDKKRVTRRAGDVRKLAT